MIHKHHIIPKHLGGTNDSKNIALLTPLEHAEAHRILWCTYRKKEDWLAAIGLEGWAIKSKLIIELSKLAGKQGDKVLRALHGENYKHLKSKAGKATGKVQYNNAPVYTWTHPIHGVFTGKAVDLCRKYEGYCASHLNDVANNKKRKQHKGWRKI